MFQSSLKANEGYFSDPRLHHHPGFCDHTMAFPYFLDLLISNGLSFFPTSQLYPLKVGSAVYLFASVAHSPVQGRGFVYQVQYCIPRP